MERYELSFRTYQAKSLDYVQAEDEKQLMVHLLGLAGETGELMTTYKKWMRDGDRYKPFLDQVSEELGDILWYLSVLADGAGLDLEDIANENLAKIADRWGKRSNDRLFDIHSFDDAFPPDQQIPSEMRIEFRPIVRSGKEMVELIVNDIPFGDPLSDNSHSKDGYRFHDVFHFAYAMVLGWSPIVRKLLDRKRRADSQTDEVEDGARAIFLEEGISAMVFEFAKDQSHFDQATSVDFELLRTIKIMTRGLEIRSVPYSEWQKAILTGYEAWRPLCKYGKGVLEGSRKNQSLTFRN